MIIHDSQEHKYSRTDQDVRDNALPFARQSYLNQKQDSNVEYEEALESIEVLAFVDTFQQNHDHAENKADSYDDVIEDMELLKSIVCTTSKNNLTRSRKPVQNLALSLKGPV